MNLTKETRYLIEHLGHPSAAAWREELAYRIWAGQTSLLHQEVHTMLCRKIDDVLDVEWRQ